MCYFIQFTKQPSEEVDLGTKSRDGKCPPLGHQPENSSWLELRAVGLPAECSPCGSTASTGYLEFFSLLLSKRLWRSCQLISTPQDLDLLLPDPGEDPEHRPVTQSQLLSCWPGAGGGQDGKSSSDFESEGLWLVPTMSLMSWLYGLRSTSPIWALQVSFAARWGHGSPRYSPPSGSQGTEDTVGMTIPENSSLLLFGGTGACLRRQND